MTTANINSGNDLGFHGYEDHLVLAAPTSTSTSSWKKHPGVDVSNGNQSVSQMGQGQPCIQGWVCQIWESLVTEGSQ